MKRAIFVACLPRVEPAKSSSLFLAKKVAVKNTLAQAPWPPADTMLQHSQTHRTNAHEQQEPAAPPASSASLLTYRWRCSSRGEKEEEEEAEEEQEEEEEEEEEKKKK